ncbi:MAG: DNRLRE domain-containing protein [Candidatus Pacearchaeota archaeon]
MNNKKKVTISLDSKVYSEFQDYCEKNAIVLSKKIEIFIKNFLKYTKEKEKILIFFYLFSIILLIIPLTTALSLTLQPGSEGKDSYMKAYSANTNYGSSTTIDIDSESSKIERGILEFNISSIPSNANIQSAVLALYQTSGTGTEFELELKRITNSWTESGATWNSRDGINLWSSAGGDYANTSYAKTTINTSLGWKEWDITNLIKEWHNGTYPNYGLILIPPSKPGNNLKQFASSDNANSTIRPKLIINYTIPLNITFVSPTPNDASTVNGSSIYVNISLTNGNVLSAKLEWMNGGNTNYTMLNSTGSNWYYNVTNLTSGTYTYKVYATDILDEIIYTSDLRTAIVNACTANIINTTWSDWQNLTCSRDQMNQSRFKVEYDSNNCGFMNVTYYEYQLVGPSYLNTSWSEWTNISCLPNDKMNQSRNLTQYDSYGCASNTTFIEYRQIEACDYCTPNLINTSWTEWYNITACLTGDYYIQERNMIQYDSNNCEEVSNKTFFERQNVSCIYAYCGDGICNTDETCSACLIDCGSCNNESSSESRKVRKKTDQDLNMTNTTSLSYQVLISCIEKWQCSEWTECSIEGIQVRVCTDLNRCGTTINKPIEIKSCVKTLYYNNIQNRSELEIDYERSHIKRGGIGRLSGKVIDVSFHEKEGKSKYGSVLICLLVGFIGVLMIITKIEYKIKSRIIKSYMLTHLHEYYHETPINKNVSYMEDINKSKLKLLLMNIVNIIIIIVIITVIYCLMR